MKIDTDTEEGKVELQKLLDAETKGLKDKNAELLGDLKKLKDAQKDVQTQLDEIKAAKEEAGAAAAEKSGDVEKVKSTLEAKHKKEAETLKAQLDQQTARLNQTLIDKGLVAVTEADPHFRDALAIAQAAVTGAIEDITNGATHYHAAGISPDWAKRERPVEVIGRHIFYRPAEVLPLKSQRRQA